MHNFALLEGGRQRVYETRPSDRASEKLSQGRRAETKGGREKRVPVWVAEGHRGRGQ